MARRLDYTRCSWENRRFETIREVTDEQPFLGCRRRWPIPKEGSPSECEKKLLKRARRAARKSRVGWKVVEISPYGKRAAVVPSGKRLRPSKAQRHKRREAAEAQKQAWLGASKKSRRHLVKKGLIEPR